MPGIRNLVAGGAAVVVLLLVVGGAGAQWPGQPKVAPGPDEPDWAVVLESRYGLRMFDDLANPVTGRVEEAAGRFRKAGPGPVKYTPLIALGLETPTRGGWYAATGEAATARDRRHELWSYQFKNTTKDLETGENLPPPCREGAVFEFDPGDEAFGLWVSNDGLDDGGAYTEPAVVRAVNRRLAGQPYKAMIYPLRDKATGQAVANSYLIGWEYSTNDDFQDVVCRVDNVTLAGAKDQTP